MYIYKGYCGRHAKKNCKTCYYEPRTTIRRSRTLPVSAKRLGIGHRSESGSDTDMVGSQSLPSPVRQVQGEIAEEHAEIQEEKRLPEIPAEVGRSP